MDSRCIVCFARVNDDSTEDLDPNLSNVQLMLALSKALRVSDSIYSHIDVYALPSIPFCTDCSFLIYDAIRILKEIKKLEESWSCIADVLKNNLSSSYSQYSIASDREKSNAVKNDKLININMESVRKTLVQCFTNCNVQIDSEEVTKILSTESPSKNNDIRNNLLNNESPVKVEVNNSSEAETYDFFNTATDYSNLSEDQFDMTETGYDDPIFPLELESHEFEETALEFIAEEITVESEKTSDHFGGDHLPKIREDKDRIHNIERVNNSEVNGGDTEENLQFLKCRFCPKAYLLKSFLEAHELQHKGRLNVRCEKCNRAFVSSRSLHLHQSLQKNCHLHNVRGPGQFKRHSKQRKHVKKITHTPDSSRTLFKRSLTSFMCKRCEKEFIKEDYPDDIFNCEIHGCGKIFYNFSLFRRHHQITCPDRTLKDFRCGICDKGFISSKNLSDHIAALHTKQFKYMCEECGFGAVNPTRLKKHMLTHSNEKPFKCHICSYSFKRNVQLLFHIRRHTNELPFLCGKCGKRFVSLQHLQIHETTHLDKKNFPCPKCGKFFANKGYVRNHVANFHLKIRKYQ